MMHTARSTTAVPRARGWWMRSAVTALLLAASVPQLPPSQAITVGPTVSATFVGFAADRVRPHVDSTSLTPDTLNDGVYRVAVTYAGEHRITSLSVGGGGSEWNTTPGDGYWIAGVTDNALGAEFLNRWDEAASIAFTDAKTMLVYLGDAGAQAAGSIFPVDVCFEDLTCAQTTVTTTADDDGDGYAVGGGDCKDDDPAVHPAATETLTNGKDDDCDGIVDDGSAPPPPANTAPSATAGSKTTAEDTPVTVTLTGSDGEDDPLTFVITTLPSNGSLTDGLTSITAVPYELAGSTVDYTPTADFSGADSFAFKVNDGDLDSTSSATVSLTVDPVADGTTLAAITSSNGSYTNKGSRTTLTSNVASDDPACRGGRVVTFTATDTAGVARSATGTSSASSTSLGNVSAQLTLPVGTHAVSLSTPATASPGCPEATNATAGTVTILPVKPIGKTKP